MRPCLRPVDAAFPSAAGHVAFFTLDTQHILPAENLDEATRPTVEELSASEEFPLPELDKELLFSSDDAPEVAADLEGMVILSPSQLLLVNDNDFGTEGAETSFWRIDFEKPLLS